MSLRDIICNRQSWFILVRYPALIREKGAPDVYFSHMHQVPMVRDLHT